MAKINGKEDAERIAEDYYYYRQYKRKAGFVYHLATAQALKTLAVIEVFSFFMTSNVYFGAGIWILVGFYSYTKGSRVIAHHYHYRNSISQSFSLSCSLLRPRTPVRFARSLT